MKVVSADWIDRGGLCAAMIDWPEGEPHIKEELIVERTGERLLVWSLPFDAPSVDLRNAHPTWVAVVLRPVEDSVRDLSAGDTLLLT
jgi:hypothetical protein